MQRLVILFALALLAGCGQTIHHVRMEDGLVRSQTAGEIGFASSELKTEHVDALMPTCVARIGRVSGQYLDEVVQCEEETIKDTRRRQRQRDIAVEPWKYIPYSYGYNPWNSNAGR